MEIPFLRMCPMDFARQPLSSRRWLVIVASVCLPFVAMPFRPCCCFKLAFLVCSSDADCCCSDSASNSAEEPDSPVKSNPVKKCRCRIESAPITKLAIVVAPSASQQTENWPQVQAGMTNPLAGVMTLPWSVATKDGPPMPRTARQNCVALCRFLC